MKQEENQGLHMTILEAQVGKIKRIYNLVDSLIFMMSTYSHCEMMMNSLELWSLKMFD